MSDADHAGRPAHDGSPQDALTRSASGEPPAAARGGEKRLPLSFPQEWVWFLVRRHQRQTPDPTSDWVYLLPLAVRLKGRLDVAVLESCINEAIRRHESLRTSFAHEGGTTLQVIAPRLTASLPVLDLTELPEADREREVQRRVRDETQRPFDLTRAPLVRASLLQLAADEHVLMITMHHLISDGWSVALFIKEVSELYRAFSAGEPSTLAELPVQYSDYTLRQHELLQGGALERELSYWKERLAGASFALELPTDFPRPPVQRFRGAAQSRLIPPALAEELKHLGRRARASLFMTLLAALDLLLFRFSGQDDILIGTSNAGRVSTEVEGLIGMFVNNIILRTDLSGNPSFEGLLSRVREAALGAYTHQNLPYITLLRAVNPRPPLDRAPLVQVFFLLQNFSASSFNFSGMAASYLNTDTLRGTRDLTFTVTEGPDGLLTSLQYNTDLFKPSTIAQLLASFEDLLQGVAANPHKNIRDL